MFNPTVFRGWFISGVFSVSRERGNKLLETISLKKYETIKNPRGDQSLCPRINPRVVLFSVGDKATDRGKTSVLSRIYSAIMSTVVRHEVRRLLSPHRLLCSVSCATVLITKHSRWCFFELKKITGKKRNITPLSHGRITRITQHFGCKRYCNIDSC